MEDEQQRDWREDSDGRYSWGGPLPTCVQERIDSGDALFLPGAYMYVPGGTDAVHDLAYETGSSLRAAFYRLVRSADGSAIDRDALDELGAEWSDEPYERPYYNPGPGAIPF